MYKMVGISNITTINMTDILAMGNFTDPMGFMINVDQTVYGGILFFILLWVLWGILFFALQDRENLILVNIMYSGGVVSVVSFFFRVIYIVKDGLVQGMLTDYQMWMFPLITILVATILVMKKRLVT